MKYILSFEEIYIVKEHVLSVFPQLYIGVYRYESIFFPLGDCLHRYVVYLIFFFHVYIVMEHIPPFSYKKKIGTRILGILYLFEPYFIYILCLYCNGTYLTFPLVYVVIEHIPSFFLGLYHHFLAINIGLYRCGACSIFPQVYFVVEYILPLSEVYILMKYI